MKQIRKASSLRQAGKLILALAMFLLLTSVVLAQSGGGYDLSWSTMDGGGGTSEGGGYTLFGIAGQPDTGPSMSGDDYTLAGGFWGVGGLAGSPGGGPIYLPIIFKNG
jgi:hypothetical protein